MTAGASFDYQEVEQYHISLADASMEQFEKTGLHVTLSEMRDWMRDKKFNPHAPRPVCHGSNSPVPPTK